MEETEIFEEKGQFFRRAAASKQMD